jgi:hypothetical protein
MFLHHFDCFFFMYLCPYNISTCPEASKPRRCIRLYCEQLSRCQLKIEERWRSLEFVKTSGRKSSLCWFLKSLTSCLLLPRASSSETDEDNIKDLFMVGYTQLETLTIQVHKPEFLSHTNATSNAHNRTDFFLHYASIASCRLIISAT